MAKPIQGLAMVYGDRVPDLPASPGDNRSETPSAKEELPPTTAAPPSLPLKQPLLSPDRASAKV